MIKQFVQAAALLLLPGLTGCLYHTRKLQIPKQPSSIIDAKADELVNRVNERYASVHSLSATVEFQAQVGGTHKGAVTDFTSFRGHILMSKPDKLRVLGQLPVVQTRAFDLASNGDTFKLLIPPKSKAIVGKTKVTNKSKNALENLRPSLFFDSMLIHSISPDEQVFVTGETRVYMDTEKKQLLEEPVYDLAIVRVKEGGKELALDRVIRFGRVDLHPFEQDIYDQDGNIETQTLYGPYQEYGDVRFPGTVTIKRPLEEYQITLTIEKLTLNQTLTDDQFELKIPEGIPIQQLN
jgi:outer membrane lipoprotein-sorting protein